MRDEPKAPTAGSASSGSTSLERFLERHPWPEGVLGGARPLEFLWSFELEAEADAIWQRIIDTSRLNRALGLTDLRFTEVGRELHGETSNLGILQRWVELPWSWVRGRTMNAARVYSRGFPRYVRVIYEMIEEGGKVRFLTYFGWLPRSFLSRLLLTLGTWSLKGRFEEVLREMARVPVGAPMPMLTLAAPPLPEESRRRVDAIRDQLLAQGLERAPIEKLVRLIREGDPADLYRLQVRRLAREWGRPEQEMLTLFLHATRLGLLDLSWDVICPHCRGVRDESENLFELEGKGSCEVCEIEFGTDEQNAIEITFHVHPSIRAVEKPIFCSAETQTKKHIHVQQVLAPGESRTLKTALPPGRLRYRIQGRFESAELRIEEGAAEEIRFEISEEPRPCALAPGARITLHNDDTAAQHTFVIEEPRWVDDALRPSTLFAFQDFRDLFSEQYIGSEVRLAVGEQTLLFTDVVGSSRLYVDRGDPEAFVEVRRHFGILHEVVREHGGAVVKTIGDATMATFPDAASAVLAASAMHRALHEAEDQRLVIRISLNTGVCIAVNLNSNIDYFGHTVNYAAKLQAIPGAHETVISESTHRAPGVLEAIESLGYALEEHPFRFTATDEVHKAYLFREAFAQGPKQEGPKKEGDDEEE